MPVRFSTAAAYAEQWDGPVLHRQPPLVVTFSNSSGAEVTCPVTGRPPVRVTWQDRYGVTLTNVPGLRQVNGGGRQPWLSRINTAGNLGTVLGKRSPWCF